MKKQIRPYYSRLQGFLHQAPAFKETYDSIDAQPLCSMVDNTIDELSKISGVDYSIHKIGLDTWEDTFGTPNIRLIAYKGKLGGLIAELHGTYFYDEPAPFSGMPRMVINQHAQQNTDVKVSVLMEADKQINELIEKSTDQVETSFLKEIKNKLEDVKTMSELLLMVTSIAGKFGITIDRLNEMFSRIVGTNVVH